VPLMITVFVAKVISSKDPISVSTVDNSIVCQVTSRYHGRAEQSSSNSNTYVVHQNVTRSRRCVLPAHRWWGTNLEWA
jgi:hypothetical protein